MCSLVQWANGVGLNVKIKKNEACVLELSFFVCLFLDMFCNKINENSASCVAEMWLIVIEV